MDTPENRFARQIMLPQIGPEGQRRLAAASVLVVGLGGLGAPAASYLAGAGVGRLGLCDPDTVSLTNLHRQLLYTTEQVGQPKALCAAERLRAQAAPGVCLEPECSGLTPENAATLIGRYDLVVDCTDNYATRYLIDDVCAAVGKPWIYGSVGGFCGQIAVMNYRSGRRYADLYAEREELQGRPAAAAGIIGATPGVVGAMQAAEAVKLICGCGALADGRLITIDLLNLNTNILDF